MSSSVSTPMSSDPFPTWALQPKRETGVKAFLNTYPQFDGRETVIAILDSGVDPGAGGMQVTTDGKRKIIDRIDASGAGDVDTSKVAEEKDGKITGLTGRELTLPSDCVGKGYEFRVGFKRAYSLYPRSLKDRIVKERQEKIWDPDHKLKTAEAAKRVQEQSNVKENTEEKDPIVSSLSKLSKEDCDAQLELLNNMDKKFKEGSLDHGPVYDIVLFHDGIHWICLIDTSECGQLDEGIRLRPFRETGDFAMLTKEDRLNVSVNVYEEGKVLQLVSMCSSHGTHVASIAAAHFPDDPDKNGIAPGAQIVSITIGDARLHSMETGTTLARAMMHIMQAKHYKVDVINMSYGEHSHWSVTGRVGDLMGQVINTHGVIWVASAGNDGPALSTVGTPPDIATNTVIGVGAFVSTEMMLALYSTRDRIPSTPYTWTSRGPTIDGDRGVCVCAPGGAITSVPNFTLRGTQLMNGTSMASPHVCGAVSLLLSGLKQNNIPYSPFSVKRALENTAMELKDNCHHAQGHGLMQVHAAYAHLEKFSAAPDRDVRFVVTCNGNAKGIHIRHVTGGSKKHEMSIKVEPVFLNSDEADPDSKINFNMRLSLSCSASWVRCPDHLDLMYVARHFLVDVDPTGLMPGVHSTYVKAYDVSQPQKGHVFEIPITVIQPEPLNEFPRPHVKHEKIPFNPGTIKRHFVSVPSGSTWAVIRVQSNESGKSGKFVVHTVQLEPKCVVHTWENHKMFNLQENGEFLMSIPVIENQILEVCLSKWWANLGVMDVSYSVRFHGVCVDAKEITIHGADAITRIDIKSHLQQEDVQPDIKLKSLVQNYRPQEGKVVPLGERDVVPPNRQVYELQLTYNFTIGKTTEVTPNFPLLSNVLYESEFESQLWMLYNSHKQLVQCGDAYPNKWSVKLEKEDYVLRLHVRSELRDVLEKMTDLPLLIQSKLSPSSGVSLDVYSSYAGASTGNGKKVGSFSMNKNAIVPVYVTGMNNNEKYMKSYTSGQYLTGTMTVAKDDLGKKVDSIKLRYVLNEAPKKEKSKATKTEPSYKEALFDHKVSWLTKMDFSSEESAKLFEELKAEAEDNQIPVYIAKLTSLENDKKVTENDRNSLVIEFCDSILAKINIEEVMAQSSMRNDARPDATELKKDLDKKKGWYIEAMAKKGLAQISKSDEEGANKTYFDLWRVCDVNTANVDAKVTAFAQAHAEMVGHHARALKMALAQLEAKPGVKETEKNIVRLMEKLGWNHLANVYQKNIELRYPQAYELF